MAIKDLNRDGSERRSIELLTKTGRTASGTTDWLDTREKSAASFIIDAAAAPATETLNSKVQHSPDAVLVVDVPSGSFTEVTSAGALLEVKAFTQLMRYVRVDYTKSGAGSHSFGFKVDVIKN